jgi:succinoglycan biosynthesis protein ExoA
MRGGYSENRGFCSIVVPVLNERECIGDCLHSLLQQDWGGGFEILVVDGGSTDGTQEIVASMASDRPEIRLADNPGRIQAAAMNLAARIADQRAAVLVRADAHALYPPHYVASCLDALYRQNATSVVVPMMTVGQTCRQRAIAAAQNSRLGNGGSPHRRLTVSQFVDHAHHAAFDRAFFAALGGYDERFSHNEDAEFDLRAAKAGGRTWGCAEARITYFPRKSFTSLARQYFSYGIGRARTFRKHHQIPRLRQLAPVAVLALCLGGVLLIPIDARFGMIPGLYVMLCAGFGLAIATRRGDSCLAGTGLALIIMHLCWAAGFLWDWMPVRRFFDRTGRRQSERPNNPGV